jgi:hypothetical protein
VTEPVNVQAKPADVVVDALPVTPWLREHFAEEWLAEAKQEATVSDQNARRREIVFAVSFAESYLFEFVRDQILGSSLQRVSEFFVPGDHRGIRSRWEQVMERLREADLIPKLPPSGNRHDREDWERLVDYRNGLVHARASRPRTRRQPEKEQPRPSKSTLRSLEPGWAVKVVVKRARRLHQAAGTEPPVWLTP